MNVPDECAAGSWPVRILRRNWLLALVMLCTASFAQEASNAGVRVLQVDASKMIGEIHSFQGVNGPPSPLMAGFPNLVEQYRDLRINLVRTHDFMGPTEVDRSSSKPTPSSPGSSQIPASVPA